MTGKVVVVTNQAKEKYPGLNLTRNGRWRGAGRAAKGRVSNQSKMKPLESDNIADQWKHKERCLARALSAQPCSSLKEFVSEGGC